MQINVDVHVTLIELFQTLRYKGTNKKKRYFLTYSFKSIVILNASFVLQRLYLSFNEKKMLYDFD